MKNTVRAFIAIELTPPLRELLKTVEEELKKTDCHVRWVAPDNIHLTLKFLGDVTLEKLDELKKELRETLTNSHQFDMKLTQLGYFPPGKHPRVVWAGIDDTQKQIETIAETIENQLARMGFPKENRSFRAHITLGRVKSPKNIKILVEKLTAFPLPDIAAQHVTSITLFQSTLGPNGPTYTPLEKFSLSE